MRVVNSELGDMTLQFRIIVRIVGNKQAILLFLLQLQVYLTIQTFFFHNWDTDFLSCNSGFFSQSCKKKLAIVSYKLIKVLFLFNCN